MYTDIHDIYMIYSHSSSDDVNCEGLSKGKASFSMITQSMIISNHFQKKNQALFLITTPENFVQNIVPTWCRSKAGLFDV